ncbi:MAG: hypothetical protein HRO68_02910 [Nitrosopumilus sp.]|nr:hypothetical protein [Nitrosopumilus sp.]
MGSFDLPLYYEVAVYQYSIYNSNPDKSKLLECGDSRVLGFESEAGIKHTEKSEIVEKLVNDVTTNAELGYILSGIGGGISWTEQITKTNELYLTKSLGYFESHKYIDKSVINNPTNWDTWVSIMDIVNIIQYLPITNPDLIILISQMNGYAKDVIHNQGLVNETQKEINKINAELDAEKEKWDVLGSHAEAEKNANKLLKPLNTKITPFTTNLKVSQDILDRTISEINKIVEAENSNERTQYSYGLQNLGKEVSLETILDMPNEISRTSRWESNSN